MPYKICRNQAEIIVRLVKAYTREGERVPKSIVNILISQAKTDHDLHANSGVPFEIGNGRAVPLNLQSEIRRST